jgi:phospholipase C
MSSRRNFLKKAAALAGTAGLSPLMPASIRKALAIDPELGSSYLDAEHVVLLMQENRSFDHTFGTLQGVRGFADPRAVTLPNGYPVWFQSNARGQTFVPFRLDHRKTNATWLGSVPHTWADQTDARNGGKYDGWLEAKKIPKSKLPLTLGYLTREDVPFYHALADAFTICDQAFCSSLTGTSPNRMFFWTGTTRENSGAIPRVRNSEIDTGVPATWKTFPERLQAHGVSWKIYQNELDMDVGLSDEQTDWLGNYGDNTLAFCAQYNAHCLPAHQRQLAASGKKATGRLEDLTPLEQALHRRCLTTNDGDPDYHRLTTLRYSHGGVPCEVAVPRGDVLYQFRKDVQSGNLPAVSWLVAPRNFSDHPASPMYGPWYVSEVLDILIRDPVVWKKTIFILCYDENDGYFDHVPPFTPPIPSDPTSGKASAGIDCAVEYLPLKADLARQPKKLARGGVIGLGYRVPLLVASPWSRGGRVNSQVFDHTSILQFLENFIGHKTGRPIVETNISAFRRAICGDLSSVFSPYQGEPVATPSPIRRDDFLESVHRAQYKPAISGVAPLSSQQLKSVLRKQEASAFLPVQEPGTRVALPLPYQLEVDGALGSEGKDFQLRFRAGTEIFGKRSAGAPFTVYANDRKNPRAYVLVAGDELQDSWRLSTFARGEYSLRVHGPNGFFRAFQGNAKNPAIRISFEQVRSGASSFQVARIRIENAEKIERVVTLQDQSYKTAPQTRSVAGGTVDTFEVNFASTHWWYDLSVTVAGFRRFSQRYAGHLETGKQGITDPAMGRVV